MMNNILKRKKELPAVTAAPTSATDVARGICRYFAAKGFSPMVEVPFGNGRRIDVAAIDRTGKIIGVEIKVAVNDLQNDRKWPEYLDYCDYFYFAVCPTFPLDLFEREDYQPGRCGLLVSDRYQTALIRNAQEHSINAQRRRAETLRFARRAARRLHGLEDPEFKPNHRSGLF